MIEWLKKESATELYHYKNGEKFLGKNKLMHGNCADLCGDCSSLQGNCTELWGNCTGLWGDCSGLSGDCTGLRGNLDFCEITDSDRQSKINIKDLIQ